MLPRGHLKIQQQKICASFWMILYDILLYGVFQLIFLRFSWVFSNFRQFGAEEFKKIKFLSFLIRATIYGNWDTIWSHFGTFHFVQNRVTIWKNHDTIWRALKKEFEKFWDIVAWFMCARLRSIKSWLCFRVKG